VPVARRRAAHTARAPASAEAARRLYRRYLEVGPDGAEGDAEVRVLAGETAPAP
jgi:hypothetical protein